MLPQVSIGINSNIYNLFVNVFGEPLSVAFDMVTDNETINVDAQLSIDRSKFTLNDQSMNKQQGNINKTNRINPKKLLFQVLSYFNGSNNLDYIIQHINEIVKPYFIDICIFLLQHEVIGEI